MPKKQTHTNAPRPRAVATPTGEKTPEPRGQSTAAIDHHVGARVRERRIMLGLTQKELAELIGLTYQQTHKYEHGTNRISAGRLYEIAQVLNVPVAYFYEGLGQPKQRVIPPHRRMLFDVIRNFGEIKNEQHQEAVSQLARALADDPLDHQRTG